MEIVQNIPASLALLKLAEQHKDEHEPRAPGLHVSDLIYCATKSWYKLHGYLEGELDEDTLAMFTLGRGHHSVFERCIPETPTIILFEIDGERIEVVGTPDMNWPEHLDKLATMPVVPPAEIKTTRYSANKTPDRDMPHYVDQLASYCLARGCLQGRLYIYHINGTYGRGDGGMRPVMKVYDVTFTKEEMQAWYAKLSERIKLVTAGDGPPYPDVTTHYKWECGYCPLAAAKGGPCPAPQGADRGFFFNEARPAWIPGPDPDSEDPA